MSQTDGTGWDIESRMDIEMIMNDVNIIRELTEASQCKWVRTWYKNCDK